MAKKDTAAQAPAKKKKNAVEAKPFTEAPRLKVKYTDEIVNQLKEKFGYENVMQIPKLSKVIVNVGCGESKGNAKEIEAICKDIATITGQKPITTKARKSVANFKLREGMPIGCRVTLRKERMWDFLDKLMNFALPRVRDFRGIPDRGFDGRGNFTLGIKEHAIFPEMEADRIENPKGMNITIVTTATTDKEGKFLLEQLGMPFRK